MKCELCELRETDERRYNLRMRWLEHAQYEEFYGRNKNGEMQDFHKNERLKIEREMSAR